MGSLTGSSPKEPKDLQTIPSEARKGLPGSLRDLLKVSLSTRPEGGNTYTLSSPTNAEKHIVSVPWDLEPETHTTEVLCLLS